MLVLILKNKGKGGILLLTSLIRRFNIIPLSEAEYTSSSRFNLPSDPVPLMGPRRLIPMVKTQYLLRKTHFWVNKKTPKGNIRGNTFR